MLRNKGLDSYLSCIPSAPVASRQGFCWPVCHIYQVIFQFSRKVEKSGAIISDFFQLFHKKVDLLVLNTSNTIPSKSLRLILTNFMTSPILYLSATLTRIERSMPPPPGSDKVKCNQFARITSKVFSCGW